MKYNVINSDGCSYVIEADSEAAALEIATNKKDSACEVEDLLGVEMPASAQFDGTGADWLARVCTERGIPFVMA